MVQLRIAGEAITRAAGSGLERQVPSCPEWTLEDLLRHVGAIHRWAIAVVGGRLTGRPRDMFALSAEQRRLAGEVPAAGLIEWFADGHAALLRELGDTAPDAQFWTFMPASSPLAFWARRQAHETAVHAIDAQLAVGAPQDVAPLPAWFAADGIDELLTGFIDRPGAAGARSATPRTMLVSPIDDPARWLVTIGPERITTERAEGDEAASTAAAGAADATVTGTAHDLYSMLWNRPSIGPVGVAGDAAVAALWSDGVKIT